MTQEERKQIFDFLDQLKLKSGEKLVLSLFKSGAKEPSFIITEKADDTVTLYRVEGKSLNKIQTAKNVEMLEKIALPELK